MSDKQILEKQNINEFTDVDTDYIRSLVKASEVIKNKSETNQKNSKKEDTKNICLYTHKWYLGKGA